MSQAYDSTALELGLPDIARLAAVQRSVVSMWRLRKARTSTPFPSIRRMKEGRPLFDALEVVEWLEATGLGNNPEHRADLAAFSSPIALDRSIARAEPEEVEAQIDLDRQDHFDALTALLCLTFRSGRGLAGLSADDVIDLADEFDPDDEFLFAEISTAETVLGKLAVFAADLVDSAYNPAAAFDLLLTRSGRLRQDPVQVAPALQSLIAQVAWGLAQQMGVNLPAFADTTAGGSDLLQALITVEETTDRIRIHTVAGKDASSRRPLRRLLTRDLSWQPLVADEHGGFLIPTDSILLAQFPSGAEPNPTELAVLEAVDELSLQLTDHSRALIVGPASALVDNLASDQAGEIRDALLRSGKIRTVLRLPAGLLVDRPRQRLALMVLGPADDDPAFSSARGLARTAIADLADLQLSNVAIGAIVNDVLAAMWGAAGVRSHTFTHLQPTLTSDLLIRRRELVLTGERAGRSALSSVAETLLSLENLNETINRPMPALHLGALPGDQAGHLHRAPVQDLIEAKVLRFEAGNRADFTGLGNVGSVRVIGVPELTNLDMKGGRAIDRWTLAEQYPDSRETKAGDVVFCTSPRPAAVVDPTGGSVVEYPARILRVADASEFGLSPRSVAADINAQPAHARAWRAWPIRRIPVDQKDSLEGVLVQVDRARQDLAARLAGLDRLTQQMVSAGASGTVHFESTTSPSTTRGI